MSRPRHQTKSCHDCASRLLSPHPCVVCRSRCHDSTRSGVYFAVTTPHHLLYTLRVSLSSLHHRITTRIDLSRAPHHHHHYASIVSLPHPFDFVHPQLSHHIVGSLLPLVAPPPYRVRPSPRGSSPLQAEPSRLWLCLYASSRVPEQVTNTPSACAACASQSPNTLSNLLCWLVL